MTTEDLQRQINRLVDALMHEKDENKKLRADLQKVDAAYAECIQQRDRMTVALLHYAIPKIDSLSLWLRDNGRRAREALDMKEEDND